MEKEKILPLWAFILPLVAIIIWSFNIVVTRYVSGYISPISISFYRWFIAFIVLTPFVLPKLWINRKSIFKNLPKLAILSAFGMVMYQGVAYTAAHYTTATNMGIINAFIPIFTIVVSFIILKERPSIYAIVGSIISLIGLVYVVSQGNLKDLLSAGAHLGDILILFAVFFYAFYGVFLKKWQIKLPILISLYVQIFLALIYHLPFIFYFGLDELNQQNIWSIVYAGLFPSIFAPLLWMLAVQYIGPSRSSIFMNFIPIFTAIIAWVWLLEKWTVYHTIGGVIILLGVALAQRQKIRRSINERTVKK